MNLSTIRRAPVALSREELVARSSLPGCPSLPVVYQPAIDGVDIYQWVAANRELLESSLLRHGAILFRGFSIDSIEAFHRVVKLIGPEMMNYDEPTSPRSLRGDKIYTSTDHPAEQIIFPHNECSYAITFPQKLYFWCQEPATTGGETPIGDIRRVYRRIAPEIVERFERLGWMYARNFSNGLGLSWRKVLHTEDPSEVEALCASASIQCEWRADGSLRTHQVRPAVAVHPRTGERVWFNHVAFFHASTLEPAIRERLIAEYGYDQLPNHTYYGDGSPIPDEVVQQLRAAYEAETVSWSWRKNDVLVLDNILAFHARAPFTGLRKVLVAMSDPYTHQDRKVFKSCL